MHTKTPQILIYSSFQSTRLDFVLDYIFRQRLNIQYELCTDAIVFEKFSGFKMNYTKEVIANADIQILPQGLLASTNIQAQQTNIQRWKKSFVLFYNQPKGKIPFDIFSAIFYCISRYEEYLPFDADKHQRFPAAKALASQYSFLQSPVVDEWLLHFSSLFPFETLLQQQQPSWQMTVDIDMLWKYENKAQHLIWAGIGKDILRGNWKSLKEYKAFRKGQSKDPFDCFEWMKSKAEKEIQYFVLTSEKTQHDRNTSPQDPAFIQKIKTLKLGENIGLHPSYFSNQNNNLQNEKETLEKIIQKTITKSRQHFIKLHLPQTYHLLLQARIKEDFSMGFASCNGFRAGTSRPFYWFDLQNNQATSLLIHPFVYMDATDLFYSKKNISEQQKEIERLAHSIVATKGIFTGIWHNYILGDTIHYPQQQQLFEYTCRLLNEVFPEEKI